MYTLSALLVTGAMLLLVLLYVALIAACAVGVLWWAFTGPGLLLSTSPGVLLRLIAYIGPLVIGGVLVAFMIKPLFAPRVRHLSLYSIERSQEPHLYAFVERVAAVIGAPAPYQIELAPFANAGASFHRGVIGLATGRLDLTIGMPLIAGMNTRQLAGVIAHELGHFSQHGGMRLSFIARSISSWFHSVVYERDRFDQWLEYRSEVGNAGGWGALFFLAARLCVWLVRQVLFVFMLIGDLISAMLLRQMELNADQYEIRLAGSDAFASISDRLLQLSMAHDSVLYRLDDAAAERRLADNVPVLIATIANTVSAKDVQEYRRHMWTAMGWRKAFSSHPDDASRVRAAERVGAEGVFRLEQPASRLLRNYEVIGKWVMAGLYRNMLGQAPPADAIVPVERIVKHEKIDRDSHEAHDAYYCGLLHPYMMLFPDPDVLRAPQPPKQAMVTLRTVRAYLKRHTHEIEALMSRFENAINAQCDIIAARALLSIGVRINAGSFGLTKASTEAANAAAKRNRDVVTQLRGELEAHHAQVEARLHAALSLLMCDAVQRKLNEPQRMVRHAARMLRALQALEQATDVVAQLRTLFVQYRVVYSCAERARDDDRVAQFHTALERDARRLFTRLRDLLSTEPYPFQSDDQSMSISTYLASGQGDAPLAQRVSDAGSRFDQVYVRVMGRLALIATKAEQVAATLSTDELPDAVVTHNNRSDATARKASRGEIRDEPARDESSRPYRIDGEPD